MITKITLQAVLFLILLVGYTYTFAWIYPEHRDITLLAVQDLNPQYRVKLDKLWFEARLGFENRLTETIIDTIQTVDPKQLDFASWPAISGDHSCSPDKMLHNVLHSDWILKVADVAGRLKIALANSENRHEHVNALRDSDVKLQGVDPQYATRAGSNNVHFLLALPSVGMAQVGAIAAHKLPARRLIYIFIVIMFFIGLKMIGVYDWLGWPI